VGQLQTVAPGVWRAELRGQVVSFPLWVSDEDGFVRFVISPFLPAPKTPERTAMLSERLLRLNPTIRMARFAVTPAGEVELLADQLAVHIDGAEVRDCLDALLYYADRYYGLLATVARA